MFVATGRSRGGAGTGSKALAFSLVVHVLALVALTFAPSDSVSTSPFPVSQCTLELGSGIHSGHPSVRPRQSAAFTASRTRATAAVSAEGSPAQKPSLSGRPPSRASPLAAPPSPALQDVLLPCCSSPPHSSPRPSPRGSLGPPSPPSPRRQLSRAKSVQERKRQSRRNRTAEPLVTARPRLGGSEDRDPGHPPPSHGRRLGDQTEERRWKGSGGEGNAEQSSPALKSNVARNGGPAKDGFGSSRSGHLSVDLGMIRRAIQTQLVYPPMSRKMGHQGKVLVTFRLSSDGRVSRDRIVESSGFPALDRAALTAVRKSNLSERPSESVDLMLPVVFSLR